MRQINERKKQGKEEGKKMKGERKTLWICFS